MTGKPPGRAVFALILAIGAILPTAGAQTFANMYDNGQWRKIIIIGNFSGGGGGTGNLSVDAGALTDHIPYFTSPTSINSSPYLYWAAGNLQLETSLYGYSGIYTTADMDCAGLSAQTVSGKGGLLTINTDDPSGTINIEPGIFNDQITLDADTIAVNGGAGGIGLQTGAGGDIGLAADNQVILTGTGGIELWDDTEIDADLTVNHDLTVHDNATVDELLKADRAQFGRSHTYNEQNTVSINEYYTTWGTPNDANGMDLNIYMAPTADTSSKYTRAARYAVYKSGYANVTSSLGIRGFQTQAENNGWGNLNQMVAFTTYLANSGYGNTTTAYHWYAFPASDGSKGSFTNVYAMYISEQKRPLITNSYGIYQAGDDDYNIILGNTTFGSTAKSTGATVRIDKLLLLAPYTGNLPGCTQRGLMANNSSGLFYCDGGVWRIVNLT